MGLEHLVIFDITEDSHFPSFMRHWIQQWTRVPRFGAKLSFVVDNYLLKQHSSLVKLAEEAGPSVELVSLSRDESELRRQMHTDPERQAVAFHRVLDPAAAQQFFGYFDWRLFCDYAERLQATHAVIAHCDQYLPLIGDSGRAPAKFSGLYFAPFFHEAALPGETAEFHARRLREKFFLTRSLRHPNLHTLFFLDHTVMEPLRSFPCSAKAAYLPEVVSLPKPDEEQVAALRAESGPERVTFLIFGHLTPRKGVVPFLRALENLPADLGRHICVRLAGRSDPEYERSLEPLLERLKQNTPILVIRRCGYVADQELAALVEASDVLVTLYQQHHGPSNVNLIAAFAGKPVLSGDTGFSAHEVRKWGLGLTVDSAQPQAIANAVLQFLCRPPQDLCDRERMKRLADNHTPERFASTFFSRLGISG